MREKLSPDGKFPSHLGFVHKAARALIPDGELSNEQANNKNYSKKKKRRATWGKEQRMVLRAQLLWSLDPSIYVWVYGLIMQKT